MSIPLRSFLGISAACWTAILPVTAAQEARVLHDMTVGPAGRPVVLKAGSQVTVMSVGAAKDVVSVTLPDGSTGIYQIEDAALDRTVSAPAPPAASSPAVVPTAPPPVPAQSAPAPPQVTLAPPAPAATTPPPLPPDFDKTLVGSPEFQTKAGRQESGTACLAETKDGLPCYLLTVRHLLGPNGGFAKETPLEEVPGFVSGIRLHTFDGSDHYYSTKGLLIKSDPADKTDLWNDIAIFPVQEAPDKVLTIADKPPAVGDPVWVIAHVRGGVPEGEVAHLARVSQVEDKWISAIFDNDNIITNGASGAPVLNAAGELVGVYSGHFDDNGHKGANMISAARIIADIRAAQ